MTTKQPDKPRQRRPSPKSSAAKTNTPDPIQIAMGIEAGALAADVLRRQSHLIDAQAREIHFNHLWHIVLRSIGAALTGFVLLGLIAMIWEAARDESLVIDAFTAPPEFTARGLSGEVIAAKIQDELNALDRETVTARSARSYANDWEGNIKVEVPQAKVSLGELRKTLHDWLGDATHISGSAYLEAGQARLEARVNGNSFAVAGNKDAIDPLVRELALAVFADTQPHRYAMKLLFAGGRDAEAFAILARLAQSSRVADRYWAHATLARFNTSLQAARAHALLAISEKPDGQWGWQTVSEVEYALGHQEVSVDAAAKLRRLIESRQDSDLSDPGANKLGDDHVLQLGPLFGDFTKSKQAAARTLVNPIGIQLRGRWPKVGEDVGVLLHERFAVDTEGLVTLGSQLGASQLRTSAVVHFLAAQQTGDWVGIVELADAIRAFPPQRGNLTPLLAEAYAHVGNHAEADAIIAALPADHYERWRTCGRIAAFRQDWAAGERCFREAIRQAPSIPRAYLDFGTMLFAKGDLTGAARQIALAHEKGPRWADPLKAWGDVLVRQGRKDEALAKYQAALEFAPAWPELKAALQKLAK